MMNREEKFKINSSVTAHNISLVNECVGKVREILSSQYYDLANSVLFAAKDDVSHGILLRDAIVNRFDEAISTVDIKKYDPIDENKNFIFWGNEFDSKNCHVKLCECMAELSEKHFGRKFEISDFVEQDNDEMSRDALGLVAYFKNVYADMAYEAFSRDIESPRTQYQNDFVSVCETVYNGECEYGILPFENSADGLLTSFYNLIIKYELKIVRQCVVLQADGQNETKFVLLKKRPNFDFDANEKRCAEIVFSPDAETTVTDILCSIAFVGGDVIRVNAVRRFYDGAYNYGIAFNCNADSLDVLMLYLTVSNVQNNLLGYYTCS